MSKISVKLNSDGSVSNILNFKYKKEGWILVDSDSAFSKENKFLWTVRESDNKLVHIATGMTPSEESTQANALLGKQVGTAIAQSGTATVTANSALDIANKSVAANAELGKAIAPVLAEFKQSTPNTTSGGTN